GVHDPDLPHPLVGWPEGAPDDSLVVGREEWAAIVAFRAGQALGMLALGVGDIDFQITVALRGEDHAPAVVRPRALGVVAARVGHTPKTAPVERRLEDVHGGIEVPLVAFARFGRWRRRRLAGLERLRVDVRRGE